jgi:BlaI family penicillinase repressor
MPTLSRREREIMEALHRIGEGDVEEVRSRMVEPPGYDSVRTILRILESKGHVRRQAAGRKHVFRPAQSRASAVKTACRNLVETFFRGSYEEAAATLLTATDASLSEATLEKLLKEIRDSRPRKASAKR